MADKRKGIDEIVTRKWEFEPIDYENIRDLGNYMIEVKNASVNNIETALAMYSELHDVYASNCCSGTIKKNNNGEVLMSHSMDVEISETPGFLSRITDGKYDTLCLTYSGGVGRYKYYPEELQKLDKDIDYLKSLPFGATDVFNEKGLYMSVDMRCGDQAGGMDCPGTNPGKARACQISAPSLIALNCATIKEAIEFLNDSYDWYTLTYVDSVGTKLTWNMAFLIGDATGEYGLVEFGKNGVYFTPYQTFQSNYYIHPLLAERAIDNHGHGRANALIKGLMDVQTENDIIENQKKARYHIQLLNPSWEYFSDCDELMNVNVRRAMSHEMMYKVYDQFFLHVGGVHDHKEKLIKYYEGDETGLRKDGMLWLGTITSGVNCTKKHATFEMWENGTIFEVQW